MLHNVGLMSFYDTGYCVETVCKTRGADGVGDLSSFKFSHLQAEGASPHISRELIRRIKKKKKYLSTVSTTIKIIEIIY